MASTMNIVHTVSSSSSSGEAPSRQSPPLAPATASSPLGRPKLRRKVTTQDDTTASQRLVEYCVIVSSRPRDAVAGDTSLDHLQQQQQQQQGNTAGNIHMPQQTQQQQHTFQPVITSRYPATDHVDDPLNPMILQFCYPAGDVIVPSTQYEMPRVHHFVLTLGSGKKLYATCLTVLEEYGGDGVDIAGIMATHSVKNGIELLNKQASFYIPKVICLLSTWPYLTAFREYLSQLYRLVTATNCMTVPIERYIMQICREIPAPPPGAYCIQLPILDSVIRFWAPAAKLPIAYTALPWNTLFEALDLDHVLTVMTALMMERKVLLVSSQYSILTVATEILCSLLFPFRWSHLYVPMLPRMLCPMLDAPVPFLFGIVRENWSYAQQFFGSDVIVVDLDRNTVVVSEYLPSPPIRKWRKLQATLSDVAGDVFWKARGMEQAYETEMLKKPSKRDLEALRKVHAPQWDEKLATLDHAFNLAYTPESANLVDAEAEESSRWDQVQEAFLRFFVTLLKDYRNHMALDAERPTFDRAGFLTGQKPDNVEFVAELCATQQFDDWVSRRMWTSDPDLVFFDQSIDAKLNRSKLQLKKVDTPFLNSAAAHKELTNLQAVPVNGEGLDKKQYIYKTLPDTFDESLFCTPRPIPKMISAEFDRQTILVSKLRAVDDEQARDDLMEFYGGDYDSSPEVASCTVFLFVYCALVGQDWQRYSQKRRKEEANEAKVAAQLPLLDHCGLFEKRDDDENNERVLPVTDEAAASFIEDVSMGCCDNCPKDGALAVKSTLEYIGAGAEQAYNAYFRKPVAEFANFSMPFNTQDEQHVGMPQKDTAIAEYEEAREVAAAQVEVAFETLATMSMRGLSVDSDAYLSLMQACGRCGDTTRALKLIELMKKDGFVADSEVLSCFIAAFAHDDVLGQEQAVLDASETTAPDKLRTDAYARFLKKGLDSAKGGKLTLSPSPEACETDDAVSSDGSDLHSAESSQSSSFIDWNQPSKDKNRKKKRNRKRKKRRSSVTASEFPVTDMLCRHLELGESLLDFVYPDLDIDTSSDPCPHCSKMLTETDVVNGWKPCAFQDYTTECPECQHRFVPRFVVTCRAPEFEGSQGNQTPLYCEFLSPWVLRKEFKHFLKGGGIYRVLDPSWRSGTDIRATLFWNLVASCRRYRLPFTFLLQGNFQNRLILPRKPDEV